MTTINILIIVSGAVVIVLLWIAIGTRHLKNLRKEITDFWENVDELLRKRQDLVPNLVETFRGHESGQEEFMKKLIAIRMTAAKQYFPGAKKIEYEYDLTAAINELTTLAGENKEFEQDTNFLELKGEIEDLERRADARTREYNEKVRLYNKSRESVFLAPLAALFRYKRADIFEFEV